MKLQDVVDVEVLKAVLYADLHLLKNRSKEQKKALQSKWLEEFLFFDNDFPQSGECDVLFIKSMVRPDYNELFDTIINASGLNNYIVIHDCKKTGSKMNPSASRFLIRNYQLGRLLTDIDISDRICCTIRICYYAFLIECLSKIKFNTLVCFADMQPIEHLAAAYFRALGRTTVTLQHGLYIDYGDQDTVNVINYLHQPSEYFLAWGQNTADLISSYHPKNKIAICGKPTIHNPGTNSSNRRSGAFIAVIFDQEIFRAQNIEMLSIALQYSRQHALDIKVRFHPHNDKQSYFKLFPSITESKNFIEAELVVGHTSSLLYEALALGCKTVQYCSNIPTIPLCESKRFSNIEELNTAAKTWKITNPKEEAHSFIAYIDKDSENQYRRFFNDICSKLQFPKFTIIIPCYNSEKTIVNCLNSILKQSYTNFEVLIIDGKSSDKTVEIASSVAHGEQRVRIFSEVDEGVYDAMNKGLDKALGEWVYFLGADDVLANNSVLLDISEFIDQSNADFVYGNVKVVGDAKWAKDGTIYDGEFTIEKICSKNICHQAIFYRTSAIRKIGQFNTKYKVCADWDINIRMWSKFDCRYVNTVVALFHSGGISSKEKDHEFGRDIKSIISSNIF